MLHPFGSSKDEAKLSELERQATDYINRFGGQGMLDFDSGMSPSPKEEADSFFSRIVDIRYDAPHIILGRVYDGVGFGAIGDSRSGEKYRERTFQPRRSQNQQSLRAKSVPASPARGAATLWHCIVWVIALPPLRGLPGWG